MRIFYKYDYRVTPIAAAVTDMVSLLQKMNTFCFNAPLLIFKMHFSPILIIKDDQNCVLSAGRDNIMITPSSLREVSTSLLCSSSLRNFGPMEVPPNILCSSSLTVLGEQEGEIPQM